ncbi:hypothetical protein TFKS16_1531 [Tannerella forsythia KS16]|uniref:Uncharacterized protein n=1 Tax=Tannerella forsythia (strain ATCC 43037 / JCM 10827 / CCUG 21028 A / KCTC 5666 / FDC 338) TaxID=203275 RepID=G8UN48_TANFA|nr:hypothetical protein BFO_1734 [Tannerella forsythia 92A2]BAR49098.1 hypothetical protein TF3313_1588 [Tannerella forsythia 3313]BAR51780.1 hypothetical protein TFKS16_1531 [Tannerella forsythia KS16]
MVYLLLYCSVFLISFARSFSFSIDCKKEKQIFFFQKTNVRRFIFSAMTMLCHLFVVFLQPIVIF